MLQLSGSSHVELFSTLFRMQILSLSLRPSLTLSLFIKYKLRARSDDPDPSLHLCCYKVARLLGGIVGTLSSLCYLSSS